MYKDSLCIQHIDCTGCPKAAESILSYKKLTRGQHIPKDKCTQNCIIFMISGELLVNSDEYPGTTLHEKQFILQAIGSKYEALALSEVEYILYFFNELPLLCEKRYKEILENTKDGPLTLTPMVMNSRLFHLINDTANYISELTLPCSQFINLKCHELVYLILNYYPLPQLRAFFYPIHIYKESLQYFVMQNHQKAKNVEDLAHMGGYNTTTFRRLFKNLYGIPAYEWMLEQKKKGILEDLQYTDMRITEICTRYGFDSLSHLAHFCKDAFGDSPRALRKKILNGEKIGKTTD